MINIGKRLTERELTKINKSVSVVTYAEIMQKHETKENEIVKQEQVEVLKEQEVSRKGRSDKGRKRAVYDSAVPTKMRSYIGRANKKGISFTLSTEEFDSIISSRCVYCGSSSKITIDRKDSSLGYNIDNCQPACYTCNMMKYTHHEDSFLEHILKVYKHRLFR